jgi:hypothetical protein
MDASWRRLAGQPSCGGTHNGAKHGETPCILRRDGKAEPLARLRGVHAGTAQPCPCAGARGCAVAARWRGAQWVKKPEERRLRGQCACRRTVMALARKLPILARWPASHSASAVARRRTR